MPAGLTMVRSIPGLMRSLPLADLWVLSPYSSSPRCVRLRCTPPVTGSRLPNAATPVHHRPLFHLACSFYTFPPTSCSRSSSSGGSGSGS